MKQPKRYLITSALPYVNGPLHIGHVAGAYLPADIYVRYLRSQGKDVVYVCGSDEHGAAITLRAKKEGVTPREIVDKYHAIVKKAFADFGMSFDIYHRTSSELHHETAQEFFKVLEAKGAFTKEQSEQFFDEDYQQFLADRYVKGACPKCDYKESYGDQCENCGSTLSPMQLIDPRSTLSGKKPVLKSTTHWYLPMQNHADWLRTWIKEGELDGKEHHLPKDWKNQVLGQCLSWIDVGEGLQPRAMTRDLDWGVKVPVKDADGKVLYVWLDAPIGYISATKQWAKDHQKNWQDYWQSEDCELVHFIGKDNIVFHCLIFPIILKAHGQYILPTNVPANEFLNLEGQKISTSRQHAVWLHEYLEDFPGRQDELRYVLCSILPESRDSEFTWKDYQARVNNELVAILGNFVNRSLVLTDKYYGGVVPALGTDLESAVVTDLRAQIKASIEKLSSNLQRYRFREALAEAMNLARIGNKFLGDTEPWKAVKTNPGLASDVLHLGVQITAELGIALQPFLPNACERLHRMLNLEDAGWEALGHLNRIAAGHQLAKPELLFQKVDDEIIEAQIAKLAKQTKPSNLAPVKDEISFDDFTKLDIRTATILEATKVPKADKLLQLTVDTGVDQRTVVSGIAEHFSPEEVVGKQVSILLNLAPRKIRGVLSQGMILMAEDAEGKLTFVTPQEAMGNGCTIR